MPGNLLVAVFVFGAVLILIAILGGPFKMFGAYIPIELEHLKRYIAGVLGTVLIAFSLIVFIAHNLETLSNLPEQKKNSHSQVNLSEDQIRRKITRAMHGEKILEAIDIIRTLNKDDLRSEECERIFSYCIKNQVLSEAKDVANECWEGEQREKKFNEIGRESLKSP